MAEGSTGPDQVSPTADSAEKAYAAAAEATAPAPAIEAPIAATPEAPAMPAADPDPVVIPPKAVRAAKAAPAASKAAKPAPAARPAKPLIKTAAKAPVSGKAKATAKAPAPIKTAAATSATPISPKISKKAPSKAAPTLSQLKDTIMATTKTPDFTEGFKDAIADVQAKAKEGYEKGTAAFGEATEFAKGNVEALVESGKILASGLKEFGEGYAAEAKAAFEALSADAKELAAVKSPTDFFKLQGELARRSFDQAIAFGSKSSEAMLKLAGEAIVPISGRIGLAMEKVKKVA